MSLRQIRNFNISKDLSILRAFVDAIKFHNGDILLSVAYRRGRTFCRYDKDFRLRFRLEEKDLWNPGFGDFRCFNVDAGGNMIIAGNSRDGNAYLFTLSQTGEIIDKKIIYNFPFLESIAFDNSGNAYLHSPIRDFPVYLYKKDNPEPYGIGIFPESGKSVKNRMAKIEVDKNSNILVAFINNPSSIYNYSLYGKILNTVKYETIEDSVDQATQILDLSIDRKNDFFCILKNSPVNKKRTVEIYYNNGVLKESVSLSPLTRRICAAPEGIIYTSETHFGVLKMLLSLKLYGAMTLVNVMQADG